MSDDALAERKVERRLELTPKFVSVAQHAQKLAVSESFVRKLIDLGKIRFIRLQGRILIPADEDERLLSESQPTIGGKTMSDNALAERKIDRELADTIAIGKGGINFDNAGQVMEYAKLMAASQSAVPKHLRGQPGACLGILDDSIRFGINPYALARKSYFVNDTLAYEAQVFMAIVNAHAPLKTRPEIRWEGEGQDRRCIVIGTFRDGAVREYKSPRFADITPKNSPLWKNDPDQQQSYFSLRGFARRWCPEVILGIHDVDELREAAMVDVSPKEDSPSPKPVPRSLDEFAAQLDADASELADRFTGGASNPPPSPAGEGASSAAVSTGESAAEVAPGGAGGAPKPPTGTATLSWTEAIDKILALATDKDLDEQECAEILDGLMPAYEEHLPKEHVAELMLTGSKVRRGELKAATARRHLEGLQ